MAYMFNKRPSICLLYCTSTENIRILLLLHNLRTNSNESGNQTRFWKHEVDCGGSRGYSFLNVTGRLPVEPRLEHQLYWRQVSYSSSALLANYETTLSIRPQPLSSASFPFIFHERPMLNNLNYWKCLDNS